MTDDAVNEFRVTIPGRLRHLPRLAERVAGFLETGRVPVKAVHDVQLVLEELTANVIRHAHDDDEAHDIVVRVSLPRGYVALEIEDDGRPFDPRTVPPVDLGDSIQDRPVGGLGLHLVRRIVATMEYSRDHGKNRLRVRIPREDRGS